MSKQSVRCGECGRMNVLPEGRFVEAHCGRCESALTYYAWVAALWRRRGLMRGVQILGAAGLLAAMFGSDVVAWWESKPFRLIEAEATNADSEPPGDPLAIEGWTEERN